MAKSHPSKAGIPLSLSAIACNGSCQCYHDTWDRQRYSPKLSPSRGSSLFEGFPVHYLYFAAIQGARKLQMTLEAKNEQLISRVYGNVHLEYPEVTRELVRSRLNARRHGADVKK